MNLGLNPPPPGQPPADVEKLPSPLRGALLGSAASLGLGLLGLLGMAELFRLLDDGSIIPIRSMSKSAALRFLGGTLALAGLYVALGWMACRRRAQRAFRLAWGGVALVILGLMLLNPFTQCATHALFR